MRTRFARAWLVIAVGVLLVGATPWSSGARTPSHVLQETAQVGDLVFSVDRAEGRDVLDFPSLRLEPQGQWLIAYLTVANMGTEPVEYDVCPPGGEIVCFDPSWFVVVDDKRTPFPADPTATSALAIYEEVLPGGATIDPGDTQVVGLAFDIPTDVTIWALMAGDGASGEFSLPLDPSVLQTAEVETTQVETTQVGMNEVVSVDGVELTATRASLRPRYGEAEDLVEPEGEFLVVVLQVAATGSEPVRYGTCSYCVGARWFELADGEGNVYQYHLVSFDSVVAETEGTLDFGHIISPGSSGEIAVVFDVPSGEGTWSLVSTSAAPGEFAIALDLDEAAVAPTPAATAPPVAASPPPVIAQGVISVGEEATVWRVVRRTAGPSAEASFEERPFGFVVAEDAPIVLADRDNGETIAGPQELAPGETATILAGTEQQRASPDDTPVTYLAIELVPEAEANDVGSDELLFTSETLPSLDGDRTVDLVGATLAAGEAVTIPDSGAGTVILATDGAIDVLPSGGRTEQLLAGEAASFTGTLTISGATSAGGSTAGDAPGNARRIGAQQTVEGGSFVATVIQAEAGSIRVIGDETTLAPDVAIELILDTSGSMLRPMEGQRRVDVAKAVLTDLVNVTLPPGVPLALRVFGDEPGSCETNLPVPLAPLDPAALTQTIDGITAVANVRTPIGAALEQVEADLAGADGPKIVVLVTDDVDTCGGDPAAAITALRERDPEIRVHVVGFAVDDPALAAQFQEWARLGGGQFFEASGAVDLGAAITTAVQPPFRVLDAEGNEVAAGVVNGEAVAVPPGTYTVEVLAAEPRRFEGVEVGPGEAIELPLEEAG